METSNDHYKTLLKKGDSFSVKFYNSFNTIHGFDSFIIVDGWSIASEIIGEAKIGDNITIILLEDLTEYNYGDMIAFDRSMKVMITINGNSPNIGYLDCQIVKALSEHPMTKITKYNQLNIN